MNKLIPSLEPPHSWLPSLIFCKFSLQLIVALEQDFELKTNEKSIYARYKKHTLAGPLITPGLIKSNSFMHSYI